MSSVIFQPLLHDSLGWKSSNSTYADTYTWKNYRASNKDKRISTYGQQYQKQMKKQQKLLQTNVYLSPTTNEEQTIQPLVLIKKNEESRGSTPASHRSTPSKTPPAVTEESPTLNVEYKQRPSSISREATCGSRASQRSTTAVEEPSSDSRHSSKEEKEKEKVTTDPNNDNSRHWLTYPNPKTPQYLIDIKQRLGQLKIPSAPIRPISALNGTVERSESSASHRQQQQQQKQQEAADQRNFFDFNLPQTPDELRASRQRLEKHRYNPALDNYPPRPKTCPVRTNELPKPLTPPKAPESEDEQLPPVETTTPATPPAVKDDVWTNNEENKPTENETPSTMIQLIDVDGLPNEYVEAVETANTAQEEYWKNLKTNDEKRPDNPVYRLPSMSSDNQYESMTAYRCQRQSTPPTNNNNNSTRLNDFGTWIRSATDKERESAMKILHDVLHQPIMGYDIPIKQQTTNRTNSATRKLGRIRRRHLRIPCEICENQMIKHHIWTLNRSDELTCPHQAQGTKPPIIQVRAS